jgi:hypothetical protein
MRGGPAVIAPKVQARDEFSHLASDPHPAPNDRDSGAECSQSATSAPGERGPDDDAAFLVDDDPRPADRPASVGLAPAVLRAARRRRGRRVPARISESTWAWYLPMWVSNERPLTSPIACSQR